MADEKKADQRVKAQTLRAKYKSATLDEFVRDYSRDISRSGMFIKTPKPPALGALLKVEIQLKDGTPVLSAVGRVVKRREEQEASPSDPAGMGIRFIKVEESSQHVIDKIVALKGEDAGPHFDNIRTGLTVPPPTASEVGNSFFGSTTPASEMPAEGDRTMMRQMNALLGEALRVVQETGDAVQLPSQKSTMMGVAAPAHMLQQLKEQSQREQAQKEAREQAQREQSPAAEPSPTPAPAAPSTATPVASATSTAAPTASATSTAAPTASATSTATSTATESPAAPPLAEAAMPTPAGGSAVATQPLHAPEPAKAPSVPPPARDSSDTVDEASKPLSADDVPTKVATRGEIDNALAILKSLDGDGESKDKKTVLVASVPPPPATRPLSTPTEAMPETTPPARNAEPATRSAEHRAASKSGEVAPVATKSAEHVAATRPVEAEPVTTKSAEHVAAVKPPATEPATKSAEHRAAPPETKPAAAAERKSEPTPALRTERKPDSTTPLPRTEKKSEPSPALRAPRRTTGEAKLEIPTPPKADGKAEEKKVEIPFPAPLDAKIESSLADEVKPEATKAETPAEAKVEPLKTEAAAETKPAEETKAEVVPVAAVVEEKKPEVVPETRPEAKVEPTKTETKTEAKAEDKKVETKKPEEKAVTRPEEKKPEEGGGMGMIFAVVGILVLLAIVWWAISRNDTPAQSPSFERPSVTDVT